MVENQVQGNSRTRHRTELQTFAWNATPGLLACFFFQGIWFFIHGTGGPIIAGDETALIEPKVPWLLPGIFWPTWLLMALFFGIPLFLRSWAPNQKTSNQRVLSRLSEMAVRLVGIPLVLFGLSVGCNFPGRLLAGWTVFHYSLALISTMVAEYRMQYRTPARF